MFPRITGLRDQTHFGRLQSQNMKMVLRDYVHRYPKTVTCIPWYYRITRLHTHFGRLQTQNMKMVLLDYAYRNPEIVTCIPWYHRITELHIL